MHDMARRVAKLGVPLMDDDHALLDELMSGASGAADAELPRLLAEIEAETRAHFGREESLMREAGVPILHCHEQQHALFLAEFRRGHEAVASGNLAALREFLADFLPGLFLDHVGSVDTMTASFLR